MLMAVQTLLVWKFTLNCPVMRLAIAIHLQKNDATLKHQKSFESNFLALDLEITQVKLLGWMHSCIELVHFLLE